MDELSSSPESESESRLEDGNIWSVVLAGGVGSRFWPVSTPERPKQLLPLIGDIPMLQDTLSRMSTIAPPERTLVLTNAGLRDAVCEMASALPRENVIAEPRPAGTCAALAWAAHVIAQRTGLLSAGTIVDDADPVMVCVHADWAIADVEAFRSTLLAALRVAQREESLVTVGIVPSRPDPGFGYIEPGERLRGSISDGVDEIEPRKVARFVEKPSRERAAEMVGAGYLWNSGIFAWRVRDLLTEIRLLTPEIAPALETAGDDLEKFFATVLPVSIDVGVLERSKRVLVIPGQFRWDDVGTWAALHRVRERDLHDNAMSGRTHVLNSTGNVVHADGATVVLYGVNDLVVVAHDGVVMVTTREGAADLKLLLDSLPPHLRESEA